MKKLILLFGVFITAIGSAFSQGIIVDAEMFKSNPNAFMGKVVTIKNVTLTSSSCHSPKVSTTSSSVILNPSSQQSNPTPVGVVGKNTCCNPVPNLTLTKWSFGPNNEQCIQADARFLPLLPAQGSVAKELSFRITPSMYLLTRVVK